MYIYESTAIKDGRVTGRSIQLFSSIEEFCLFIRVTYSWRLPAVSEIEERSMKEAGCTSTTHKADGTRIEHSLKKVFNESLRKA